MTALASNIFLRHYRHMLRKHTYLFIIFCVMMITSMHAAAQADTGSPRITGVFEPMKMEAFLLNMEQRTGYRFYFNKLEIDSLTIAGFSVTNEPLESVLKTAFVKTGLVF